MDEELLSRLSDMTLGGTTNVSFDSDISSVTKRVGCFHCSLCRAIPLSIITGVPVVLKFQSCPEI